MKVPLSVDQEQDLIRRGRNKYFKWIVEVCRCMGLPSKMGVHFVQDPNWYGCYDDGMSPEAALQEAKDKGVITAHDIARWHQQALQEEK